MGPGQVRSIGLRPPYSVHSRVAAVLLVLLTCGVLLAACLPKAHRGHAHRVHTAAYEQQLLRYWRLEAPIWALLLCWLLMTDPKARDQLGANDSPRCRHGCASVRRPRTRHCRLCNKCVDGFDHHCLWLNTCVGTYNYRAWLCFVAALFVWATLSSSIAWTVLWQALALRGRVLAVGYRPALLLTGLVAALVAGWLLALLVLHAYFAWKDLTTLEWIISREGGSRRLVRQGTSEILAGASGDCDPEAPTPVDVPRRTRQLLRRRSTSEILAGASADFDPDSPVDIPFRRWSTSEILAGASGRDCDPEAPVDVPMRACPSELQGG